MAGFGFDFMNAGDEGFHAVGGDGGTLAEFGSGLDGDDAGTGERVGGGELDAQPVVELALFGPDAGHLRTGVAGDQDGLLKLGVQG